MNLTFIILICAALFWCSFADEEIKVFVGFGNGTSAQSEILEFPSSQSNTPCTATIPDYPLGQVWGTVGAVIQDKIVLCGGAYWGGDVPLFWSEECFFLEQNAEDKSLYWEKFPSMNRKRAWASSAVLADGSWLVMMGQGQSGEMTHTSEIYNISTQSWTTGPEFPLMQSGHCTVSLNTTHLLLVGGWKSEQCFIYDIANDDYIEVPPLLSGGRDHHTCVRTADGRVAVAGGCLWSDGPFSCATDDFLVEVEYFDTETLSWSSGPPLEFGIQGSALVADGDDILLLGGMSAAGLLDTIFRLKTEADKWELLEVKLQEEKMSFPAFPVQSHQAYC